MNHQPDLPQDVVPERVMTAKQAIEALSKAADGLRKNPNIAVSFGEGDPRLPITITRHTWFTAANNLLASGKLSKEERKQVQKMKMGLALSDKKK